MRKASLTQERRERLIAALPDEHFWIDDVKRVLVRIFRELNTVSLMDIHNGRGTITLDPRQRIKDENKHHTHVDTAVLLRLDKGGQTQRASMTKPM